MLSPAAKQIAEEAKDKKMFLYDPNFKKWYSPDDFMHIFTYANASDEFLSRLQIRDPMEGIEAGFIKLKQGDLSILTKLEGLVKTVVEWYRKG